MESSSGSYQLLTTLLANKPDEQMIAFALSWLENNSSDPQAQQVFKPLSKERGLTPEIDKLARDWFDLHRDENAAADFLHTFILEDRKGGHWRKRGLEFVKTSQCNNRDVVLSALLEAEGCSPELIELAYEYELEQSQSKRRPRVFAILKKHLRKQPDVRDEYLKNIDSAELRDFVLRAYG